MHNFAYARAQDAAQAVAAQREHGARFIAGGTEMLNWMRLGIAQPTHLVDLGGVPGLDAIAVEGDRLTIGALATLAQVGEHPLVQAHAGVLAQACLKAASPQIRHRATLGGNVLQKTRCPYFRAEAPLPWPCNKRQPGTGCAAREGLNETHAILGWTDACVATQPSDPAVALACLEAQAEVLGLHGRRLVPMDAFHCTPEEAGREAAGEAQDERQRREAQQEHRLDPAEIILAYHLPLVPDRRWAYVKVRERESYEYALVSAAAAAVMADGRIRGLRLALGSVAQKAWRLPAVEQALQGRRAVQEEVLPVIEQALAAAARPLAHNAYKVPLAARAAARAVVTAGGGA
jgi:xanthine dehydrogenase YagS FAD-binding subunit